MDDDRRRKPSSARTVDRIFVPESERWKEATKKGGRSPIVEIFSKGLRRKTLLAIAFAAVPLIGTWAAISGWLPMWIDQLAEQAGNNKGHAKALAQIVVSIGAITGCLIAPVIGGSWDGGPCISPVPVGVAFLPDSFPRLPVYTV